MFLFATSFLTLLHSYGICGAIPTYEELQRQLPITLTPGGSDQYFFFIIPVQKTDDPNVVLQMAQAQSATNYTNSSLASSMVDTIHKNVDVSSSNAGEDIELDKFFNVSDSKDDDKFDFQVPVVVPLDFQFTHNPATSGTNLPECSVDSRTWKEKVIARIAEILDLDGRPSWDHSDLNLRLRLRKDALMSVILNDISTVTELSLFSSTIQTTKYLADIRYFYVINDVTSLTSDHVPLMAEGVDTYSLVIQSIKVAEEGIAKFAGDPAHASALAVEQGRIDLIKPSAESTLTKFQAAFNVVKDMQIQEDNEAANDIE